MKVNAMLQAYADRRDAFLLRVVHDLKQDDRFVAAWLAGSFGRGEADLVSDLDLHVVITDDYAQTLLEKPAMVWASSTPERMALIRRYGEPVILHENHWNAICEGTFTYCEYADLTKVDWMLMAKSKAVRPCFTRLLFERAPIPQAAAPESETLDERKLSVTEQVGYLWLMMATGCKYIIRGDVYAVIHQFKIVHDTLDEIERLLQGKPAIWGQHYLERFTVTDVSMLAWVQRVRELCAQMRVMSPRIEEFVGGPVHPDAFSTIDTLLNIADHEDA